MVLVGKWSVTGFWREVVTWIEGGEQVLEKEEEETRERKSTTETRQDGGGRWETHLDDLEKLLRSVHPSNRESMEELHCRAKEKKGQRSAQT